MNSTRVNSVEEAVNLATELKRKGKYNWFRGQSEDWRPDPTFARLGKADAKKAVKRLERFFLWIHRTPGLEALRENADLVIATAQHYGIPASFLDFTTEPSVAGFFASSSNKKAAQKDGCIFCLNTKDLADTWSILSENSNRYPPIDFIDVKVPNLWRLEAQHGVFLFCPGNWDSIWGMYRIVFPKNAPPSYPPIEQIFPSKKSQLELLLDHYFKIDKYADRDFIKEMKAFFPEAKVFKLKGPKDGIEKKCFNGNTLPVLKEWEQGPLKRWLKVPAEPFHKTTLGEIALRVNLRDDPKKLRESVAFGVFNALQIDPTLRKKSIRWINLPHGRIQKDLSNRLEWVWNGLRCLPYKDKEIAEAVGLCFALHRIGYSKLKDHHEQQELFSDIVGPSIRVQFDSWDGSYVDAFVCTDDLLSAIREDIETFLRPKYQRWRHDVASLMLMCSNHKRLFRFRDFVHIFGTQVVPAQLMQRDTQACHFSPARLEGFGLP